MYQLETKTQLLHRVDNLGLSNQATKLLVPLSLSSSRFSTMCTVLFAMSMQPSNSTTHQRPKQHTLLHNVGSLGVNDHETKQLYNPPEPQINQFSIRWTCSHATKQPMHPFLSNTCFSTMCTGLVRNDHAAEQLYKPPTPQTITHVSRQYGQSWPQWPRGRHQEVRQPDAPWWNHLLLRIAGLKSAYAAEFRTEITCCGL